MHVANRRPRRGRDLGPAVGTTACPHIDANAAHRTYRPGGCLGLPEARIRVVAPDVGGGFGYKGILLAEEVCAGFLCRKLGHPVRWIEDAGNSSPVTRIAASTITTSRSREADGTLIGIDAERWSMRAPIRLSISACLEAAQVASILPALM